jgi:hypothetical protein
MINPAATNQHRSLLPRGRDELSTEDLAVEGLKYLKGRETEEPPTTDDPPASP